MQDLQKAEQQTNTVNYMSTNETNGEGIHEHKFNGEGIQIVRESEMSTNKGNPTTMAPAALTKTANAVKAKELKASATIPRA